MYKFEKLDVWKKTREFVNRVYKLTDNYPKDEKFGLTQHTRKSAISALSNIAEGAARFSNPESQRFIEMAQGSLCETVAQLYVAVDNSYIKKTDFNKVYDESEIIAKMLSSFWKSLN